MEKKDDSWAFKKYVENFSTQNLILDRSSFLERRIL